MPGSRQRLGPKSIQVVTAASVEMLLLAMLLISQSAGAVIIQGGRGMLFGADHAFTVTANSDWVLDNQSGVNQGLHMVFYPKGETWTESPAIIYGRAIANTLVADVERQVENTVNEFRENGSPGYKSERQPPITLPNGRKAELYFFSGDQWGNYEAAVYFQEKDSLNFLVFNSRSEEIFNRYFGDFQQIASSYQNLYKPAAPVTAAQLADLKSESAADLKKPGGQAYESKAVQSVGPMIAAAMRDCTANKRSDEMAAFSYFVQIDNNGDPVGSSIYPRNELSACFSGGMSGARYPAHEFELFLLNIEMKVTP